MKLSSLDFWVLFFSILQDTGISVRKRVIKILRDICINHPDFPKTTEIYVKIIRRICDEEGIKVWVMIIIWSSMHVYRTIDSLFCVVTVVSEIEIFVHN